MTLVITSLPNVIRFASLSKEIKYRSIINQSDIVQFNNYRFAGKKEHKNLLQKTTLWLALTLSAIPSGTLVKNSTTTYADTLQTVNTKASISKSIKQKYSAIEQLWQETEAIKAGLPARMVKTSKLKTEWDNLRKKAIEGDKEVQKILHALLVNRMYDELIRPSVDLIRFDYEGFNDLVCQKKSKMLTEEQFRTKIRWQALKGLYNYFNDRSEDNELVQDVKRFFEPAFNILQSNTDPTIQTWGHCLIIELFKNFTPEQQKKYIQYNIATYEKTEPGYKKVEVLSSLATLYNSVPDLPDWKEFLNRTNLRLQDKLQYKKDLKYDIVFLGLIRDQKINDVINHLSQPYQSPDIQQAVAWLLGRVKTEQGFKILENMIKNPQFDPLAQEMAIYSLAEHARQFPEKVMLLLYNYAPKENPNLQDDPSMVIRDNVREAARAMREKLRDKSQTESDFYINKFLKTDADKAKYRQLRDKYFSGLELLTTLQKNIIDKAVLPYWHHLEKIIAKGGHYEIIQGGITNSEVSKSYIGVRDPDGRLNDFIKGTSAGAKGAVTSKERIVWGFYNTIAHEFIHQIHQMILNKSDDQRDPTVESLYKKAIKQNLALDDYALTNSFEYLAQGGEAMDGLYRYHGYLWRRIFDHTESMNGSDNIRSKLKNRDPELYEFLKSLRCIPIEISMKLLDFYTNNKDASLNHIFEENQQILPA